jgi:hypothetical protein
MTPIRLRDALPFNPEAVVNGQPKCRDPVLRSRSIAENPEAIISRQRRSLDETALDALDCPYADAEIRVLYFNLCVDWYAVEDSSCD